MTTVLWGLAGFIAVVLGLVAYSVTAPRRGRGVAIGWGIACVVVPPAFILWGIYMGLTAQREAPEAG